MPEFGLIQVYTGNGKGKTTASLGLALRACGHGFHVYMVQFMKAAGVYGENKAGLPGLTIVPAGRASFVNLQEPDPVDRKLAREGWEKAKRKIASGDCQIVILDEINVALSCGLLDVDEVVAFLREKKYPVEIVLTGRNAPSPIIEIADLVTEMKEVKHPFQNGVDARQGIEY
ncbi:atp:cob(i)alamin adenosyltransferase coba/cobo/butr [Lucifera butyrica]|uniref:Atp:cob(I)alamin adenosyltransferase coba/cobo/butr n=1 Tax=Lucifera butyrica TaxID=1351585 RepID=A0A498R424_9FIRM|nr:cob(I)yrinic acid a,c-diamide adenosyltransferase [Lucifera butyrica]VBB06164.1 atp:cob(i)alamin adenosyltransferase coba/cobo/butr [Lucifera butyrica]